MSLAVNAFTVRQATVQDLGKLVPLFDGYRQFYGRPPDLGIAHSFLAMRFRHHESVIFIALDDGGEALGFTQLYPGFSSVWASRIYTLNDLFVMPAARCRGVAAKLIAAAADYGRAVGAIRLTLSTAVDNMPAQKLYENLGWKRDHVFYVYNLAL